MPWCDAGGPQSRQARACWAERGLWTYNSIRGDSYIRSADILKNKEKDNTHTGEADMGQLTTHYDRG